MKKFYFFLLPTLIITVLGIFMLTKSSIKTEELFENEEENEEYDGPDKAAEWLYNLQKDPATGKVPTDKIWQAIAETEQLKNQQLSSPNSSSALTWVERGSYTDAPGPFGNSRPPGAVTSGRIDAILVDKADATGKTVWIGGDMGGLWKTSDITTSPANWTLVNDFMGNLIISAITQDPSNTNIMYIATGEGYYGQELGVGVFKSIDHGITWTLLPSTAAYTKNTKILCDNAGIVYLATTLNGLRRSSDGGATWIDITPIGVSNRICDLELSSTGRMHICVGISGTAQDYRYTDIPSTVTSAAGWTAPITTFVSGTQRAEIGVNGNILYALPCVSNQVPAIYKSIDGGANWTSLGAPPASFNVSTFTNGQAWYDLAVAINPSNPDECVIGGLDNAKTTNGGVTWTRISQWVGTSVNYVHADQHTSIWYDNGNKLLMGNDGGIFYSSNGGTNCSDRNIGLRLKQFYSCAMHPSSTNYFMAGAQDNGTHQFNGAGLTSSVEVTGGDGAFVDIDQDQPQYQFGAYVYSQYRRSTDGGATWSSFNFSSSAGQFINPFDFDDVGNRMYCSYSPGQYFRWDNPQTATSVGSSITAAIPVTSFGGGSVIAVSVSPFTADRVYFGTNNGRVVKVDNANTATPVDVNITGAGMSTGSVKCINTGSTDQNLVACFSSYGVTNVWVSSDGGTTWAGCDGNLPNMPVYSAIFHPDDNNKMIIATETGVWETDALNGGATVWTPSANFPTVNTSMLKYRSSDRTLLASTYGRGLWTTTIPNGCTSATITTQPTNSAICAANNTTFTVAATGISYQWQLSTNGGGAWGNITNGGVYSGATTTTLTLTGVTAPMNSYQYRCVVTGDCSATPVNSNAAILTVNAATIISSQPTGSIICAGATTTFGVAATGSSITYQWQVSTNGGTTFNNLTNTAPYSGVTTNTLTITSAGATLNTYQYRCIIGSACTPLNSNAAILTVNAAPAITSQPTSTSICAANSVTFSVGASGAGLGYQWQLSTDGVTFNNIAGANAATYSFVATLAQNNYQYRCIVSGTCVPAVTSNAAVLSVGSTLLINNQPATAIVCAGGNATYSINVSGTVTYQWQESTNGGTTYTNITNGGIYANATTATLTLTGVPATANNNLYRCVVSGNCPSINSNGALLTVNTAPAFITQPVLNSIICATQNTSFTVAANGTAVGYQWQVSTDGGTTYTNITNGGVYSNATTATLNITGATVAMNNYKYRCVANGTCTPSANSNAATLTVYTAVTVSANPAGVTICENSNTNFTVTAAGTTPTYQWQVSTNGGTTFTNVANGGVYSGATTNTLALTAASFGLNNNQYRCVVNGTAPCGALNSAAATLLINAAPALVTVTGGGAYCIGGTGVAVGVSNSTTGFTYQLQLNGVNNGTALAGTGAALSFGLKTSAGNYTVVTTNNTTSCTQQMTGSVNIIVNPLPTIALNAAPYRNLFPGLVTTLTATGTTTATPSTLTYLWFKNNVANSNSTNTQSVNISGLGNYRVAVTDANGCVNQSQLVTIADSANNKLFIYPSPNDGQFTIAYYNAGGTNVSRTVSIFNAKGQVVYKKDFAITLAYQLLSIDMRRNGAGVYYVVLSDAAGNKLQTGEVMIR